MFSSPRRVGPPTGCSKTSTNACAMHNDYIQKHWKVGLVGSNLVGSKCLFLAFFSMEKKTTCHSLSLQIQWLPSCTSQVEDDLLSHTLPTVPLDCLKLSMRSHPIPWARASPVEKRPESLPKRHLCHSAVQTLQSRRSEMSQTWTNVDKPPYKRSFHSPSIDLSIGKGQNVQKQKFGWKLRASHLSWICKVFLHLCERPWRHTYVQ